MTLDAAALPEHLLGETMTRAEFLTRHWQRVPLHVRGARDRFRSLFDRASLPTAAAGSENIKFSTRDIYRRPQETPGRADQIQQAFDQGATVCLSGVPEDERLSAFLRAFERWLPQAGDLSFNCYWSPDGKGFSLHFDDHPVWILQIEGSKRWSYSRKPHPRVLGTATLPDAAWTIQVPWQAEPIRHPGLDALDEVVLEPGDVLYLPEGCWHRAAAVGESLALTLACNRVSPLDLLQRAMGPRLLATGGMMDNLSGWATLPALDPAASLPDAVRDDLQRVVDHVRAVAAQLTVQDLQQVLIDFSRKPPAKT